jgi:hypothetical protein
MRISVLLAALLLSSCGSIKEAGWVSGTALATGAAASALTGTLPAVAAGAAAGGITAMVIDDDSQTAAPSAPEQATTGWGALAVLFATSGKWIGICALVFIILGWFMPSPFKLNRRDNSAR